MFLALSVRVVVDVETKQQDTASFESPATGLPVLCSKHLQTLWNVYNTENNITIAAGKITVFACAN